MSSLSSLCLLARFPRHTRRGLAVALAACALTTCGPGPGAPGAREAPTGGVPTGAGAPAGTRAPARDPIADALAALAPAPRLEEQSAQGRLRDAALTHFAAFGGPRVHLFTDKPLYHPGETIWLRVWALDAGTLLPDPDATAIELELRAPDGSAVTNKRLRPGPASIGDVRIPDNAAGGAYTLIARAVHPGRGSEPDGRARAERRVVIASYQPPRIIKTVEFLRTGYRPGERVNAAVSLRRAGGEPLAGHAAEVVVAVGGQTVSTHALRTDAAGNAGLVFDLPRDARGDGLLTLLVADGGVTESVQRRVPIAVGGHDVAMYPEGGALVAGLPGRVYVTVESRGTGEPADVTGRVVDDQGRVVSDFRTRTRGMGTLSFTPEPGRRYRLVVDGGDGADGEGEREDGGFEVPAAVAEGCVLRAVDPQSSDAGAAPGEVRVGVWCSEPRTVIATALLREQLIAHGAYAARGRDPIAIALPVPAAAQGAVRFTLFAAEDADGEMLPLAERLIYVNRGADMHIAITSDRQAYTPRDRVTLAIETRDPSGAPVPADLALAVVDATALAHAAEGRAEHPSHLLSAMYLEAEMPGQTIADPGFYFSEHPDAPAALDLVLGTQGWRGFAWRRILSPDQDRDRILDVDDMCPLEPETYNGAEDEDGCPDRARVVVVNAAIEIRDPGADPAVRPEPPPAPPADPVRDPDVVAERRGAASGRDAWEGTVQGWAPVRVFPAPSPADGIRRDFRETAYFAARVVTDAAGRAEVAFHLPDSVTSYRVTAQGAAVTAANATPSVQRGQLAMGLLGRGVAEIRARLPISLSAVIPHAVTVGDAVRLPITVANDTDAPREAEVTVRAGPALAVPAGDGRKRGRGGEPAAWVRRVAIPAHARAAVFADLRVRATSGERETVAIEVAEVRDGRRVAGAVADTISHAIAIEPAGYPAERSVSGTLAAGPNAPLLADVALPASGVVAGSIRARATFYPSPLASMVEGADALLAEPAGCFEQASSQNYPNVLVLRFLRAHGVSDPALVARTRGLLARGYAKLSGYESPNRGYEWFGADPGHEALTAYGLLEFADMAPVHDVDPAMVERTAAWLAGRRDGRGGYRKNARALDSFGAASDAVTDGYIAYALSEFRTRGADPASREARAAQAARQLAPELDRQRQVAADTRDPYLLALAAHVLLNLDPGASATAAAVARLARMQARDGSFPGADHSITRSGGVSLAIETTALAAMALMRAGDAGAGDGYAGHVRQAITWLTAQRGRGGRFGATQSTILALEALVRYAETSRAKAAGGAVSVSAHTRGGARIRGPRARARFAAGQPDAVELDGLGAMLAPGANRLALAVTPGAELPYSVHVTYRTAEPRSSPGAPVTIATRLAGADAARPVKMGHGVRLIATIENVSGQGLPMTVARVGLPGGLAPQTWQLDELRTRGVIDYYETRPREVVLYFRALAPGARREVPLALLARVPGRYASPAASAYLYYTDEIVHWAPPVSVAIEP